MARTMSSGSSRRIRRSRNRARSRSFSSRSRSASVGIGGCSVLMETALNAAARGAEVEADQHALGVRQIADDLTQRFGELPDQGRDRQDLVVSSQARVLEQVDDVDVVSPGEVLLAKLVQVANRGHALDGLAGNVEA